jgi:16S rRNA (guanine966-N2)-methyltransferase
MRVIGGKFGRRALRTLPGLKLRPTSDRLRETLFDILGDSVQGTRWVDLYAGTGAVGIEALSRGASAVMWVESQRRAVGLIRQNLQSLGIETKHTVLPLDAMKGLRELQERGFRADVVFLDPPYAARQEYSRILEFIGESGLLMPAALVVAEHLRKDPLPHTYPGLLRWRVVEQGGAALSFYRLQQLSSEQQT